MSSTHGQESAGRESARPEFDVRRFGAVGDGRSLATAAINQALRAAEAAGGGIVVVPAGDYLCHSIQLRSHVTLRLGAGATLIAADPPGPGEAGGYDAPEAGPANLYQDFGHSRFRNSLIWGEQLDGVVIEGPGRIFGRGLSRGNGRRALPVGVLGPQPPGHLPDVLEADGPVPAEGETLEPGPFGYPNRSDTLPSGVGNKAIALRECRRVLVRDVTILHGGHFAVLATGCDHVTLDHLLIDTNRDGIDIDGCANVRISRCSVNSPWDDAICVKSSYGLGRLRVVEAVTISDCFVSGFVEGTLLDGTRRPEERHRGGPIGRIKLGTEGSGGFRNIAISNCVFESCRGLALEQVDGADLEQVVVTNLTMHRVMNAPIFIRLGGRLRAPGAEFPGRAGRIAISQVSAHLAVPDHGIFIAGLDGHPVTDVHLDGIQIFACGGAPASTVNRPVAEMVRDYPEPYLFGPLPAWGLYVRHAARIRARNLSLHCLRPDPRPVVHLEDVDESDIAGLRVSGEAGAAKWTLNNVRGLRVRDSDGRADEGHLVP